MNGIYQIHCLVVTGVDRSATLIELAESVWLVSSSGADKILDEFGLEHKGQVKF